MKKFLSTFVLLLCVAFSSARAEDEDFEGLFTDSGVKYGKVKQKLRDLEDAFENVTEELGGPPGFPHTTQRSLLGMAKDTWDPKGAPARAAARREYFKLGESYFKLQRQLDAAKKEVEAVRADVGKTLKDGKVKDSVAKQLRALKAKILNLSLNDDVSKVDLAEHQAGALIKVVELALDDSILSAFVQAKLTRLVEDGTFCDLAKQCSDGGKADASKIESLFPDRASGGVPHKKRAKAEIHQEPRDHEEAVNHPE